MADPERNANRIAGLRDDLDDMHSTLRDEIRSAKGLAARWGFRVVVAHFGVGATIITGLVLALLK